MPKRPSSASRTCLADAAAKALLTDEASRGKAAAAKRPVLTSADLDDPTDMTPLDPRGAGLTADHPAYLIYTSGSTGAPKGIVITHRNICHFLRSANEVYGLQRGRRDVPGRLRRLRSVDGGDLGALSGRARRCSSPRPAMIGDVERLPDILREAGVTVLDTVPTLLAMLPRDVPSRAPHPRSAARRLPPALVERWAKPGRRFFNT